MKKDLLFDFTVDKAANSVTMIREFNADQSLVWDAFTKPEILDLWGAPHPWTVRTKSMDFKVGGRRFYAMCDANGEEKHFSVQDYTSITPKTNFQYLSGFADSEGTIHPEMQGSENDVAFSETNGITTVKTTIKYKSAAILQMMVERGFKQGSGASFDNLDKLLPTLSQQPS